MIPVSASFAPGAGRRKTCEPLRGGRIIGVFGESMMEPTSSTAPAERITDIEVVENYVGGRWLARRPAVRRRLQPRDRPVIAERRCRPVRTSMRRSRRRRAFPPRHTPVVLRARALFRFVELLEAHADDIARTVTTEHGKTLGESRGSVRPGIECVEVACAPPR